MTGCVPPAGATAPAGQGLALRSAWPLAAGGGTKGPLPGADGKECAGSCVQCVVKKRCDAVMSSAMLSRAGSSHERSHSDGMVRSNSRVLVGHETKGGVSTKSIAENPVCAARGLPCGCRSITHPPFVLVLARRRAPAGHVERTRKACARSPLTERPRVPRLIRCRERRRPVRCGAQRTEFRGGAHDRAMTAVRELRGGVTNRRIRRDSMRSRCLARANHARPRRSAC